MGIWGEGMLLDIPTWIAVVLGAAWLPACILSLSSFIGSLHIPGSADPQELIIAVLVKIVARPSRVSLC
jgi:hypothetical protein